MQTRVSRRLVPIFPLLFAFTAASTGTVLASDACGVYIVKTLTDAARSAQQHTQPAHKHTKETLAQWEVWGNLYLAKHGHPYVPPKRNIALHPLSSDEQQARFKIECELPPVPTIDLAMFPMLPPEDIVPVPTDVDLIPADTVTRLEIPQVPGVDTGTSTGYSGQPIFFGPVAGTPVTTAANPATPPITPPVTLTPEPGSLLLLGTGLLALFTLRGKQKLFRMS